MIARRIPPVHSPIAPGAVIRAVGAVLGDAPAAAARALEEQLATRYDARLAILTDSGTSALVLALRAAPAGAPVAMPAYVCVDLIAAAIRAPARVLFYDVDPETLSPDLASLERVLAAGARTVVVAPLYGYPADLVGVRALAAKAGARVVEDAAQGAGGTLGGRRAGSSGDLTVLSFGRGKGTTAGGGGALLIREPGLMEWGDRARGSLDKGRGGARALVMLAAQWTLGRPALYQVPASVPALKLGEMVYHEAHEPRAPAATMLRMLPSALSLDDAEVRVRRANAERLMSAARAGRLLAVRSLPAAIPGYLRLAMLDPHGDMREAPRLGVLRGYPVTLDAHPESARVRVAGGESLAGARTLRDTLFTVPTHSRLAERDLSRLEALLADDTGTR